MVQMFSSCSGPCETCKTYILGVTCLAGHGDDDYDHADEAFLAALKPEKWGKNRAKIPVKSLPSLDKRES